MRFSAILLLLLAAASPVAAQDRMQVPPPGLPSLPADGPMRFMLHRSAAMAANATRMNAVLAALKAAGVADRDVQTTGLSLNPQYRYEPNQSPILTGYQARNSISLRTMKLGDAGKLIDVAIKAGANEVQGPEFTLANSDAALDGARTAAVAKARARAELYANAAGLKVKRIASISEGAGAPEPGPRPMMRMAMAEAGAAPPVQPGELPLSAQVTISFELEGQP